MLDGHLKITFFVIWGLLKKTEHCLLSYYKHVFPRFILQVYLHKQFSETFLFIPILESIEQKLAVFCLTYTWVRKRNS